MKKKGGGRGGGESSIGCNSIERKEKHIFQNAISNSVIDSGFCNKKLGQTVIEQMSKQSIEQVIQFATSMCLCHFNMLNLEAIYNQLPPSTPK